MNLKLSRAAVSIHSFLQQHPAGEFHINELIRETRFLPRSVTLAIKQLEERQFVKTRRIANLKLVTLNSKKIPLPLGTSSSSRREPALKWIKIVTRKLDVPFQMEVGKGCEEYFPTLLKQPKNSKLYQYNWYNSLTNSVYAVSNELRHQGELVAQNLKDSEYAKFLVDEGYTAVHNLIEQAQKFTHLDLVRLSPASLRKQLLEFQKHYRKLMPFLVLGVSLEYGLINKIKEELQSLHKGPVDESLIKQLITPVDIEMDDYLDSLKLVHAVRQGKSFSKIIFLIKQHVKKYAFLPMSSPSSEPLDEMSIIRQILYLVQREKNPLHKMREIHNDVKEAKKHINEIFNSFSASAYLRNVVQTLQEFIVLRTVVINAFAKSHYFLRPFLLHVATRMSFFQDEAFLLSFDEIADGLRHPQNLSRLRQIKLLLQKRKAGWAILSWKGVIKIISGPEAVLEAIERYQVRRPFSGANVTSITGMPAYTGRVTGRARVVRSIEELSGFQEGEILVTTMTTPEFTSMMVKAKAFVTDEGGVTCHAAIVAREFRIPCVVGTKVATHVIKTGQYLNVDGISGKITLLETEPVLEKIERIQSGVTVFPGRVRGRIKVATTPLSYLPEPNYILVLKQAEPAFLPLLYRAKGMILEDDSMISHGYFYAHALKLPTLMGVTSATLQFKDEQKVDLDAKKGQVTIISPKQ